MMKHSLFISTLIAFTAVFFTSVNALADITGEWKLHPTFDNSVLQVIDTPGKVYFSGYNQTISTTIDYKKAPDQNLFYYDKEGDEIVAVASRHNLSATTIRKIEYNPAKRYLIIIYEDSNIDLLMDSGEVRNISAIKNADIPGAKDVNFISFDADNDRVWLATKFGYVCLNDKKFDVAESRNYNTDLKCVARVGDYLYFVTQSLNTLRAKVAEPRLSLDDYTAQPELKDVQGIYPLTSDSMLVDFFVKANSSTMKLTYVDVNGAYTFGNSQDLNYAGGIHTAETGYIADNYGSYIWAKPGDRYFSHLARFDELKGDTKTSTWNFTEVWNALPRKGLRGMKVGGGSSYTLIHDYMLPNAPNAYFSRGMAYHPRYGMLVNSHGVDAATGNNAVNEPILLSGLKNGIWTSLSPAYRNPAQLRTGFNPLGVVIDQQNDKYVYMGSNFSGFTRLNLDDPQDILHYSFPGDETASLPGYVETNPIIQSWKRTCPFSAPAFDANGTLWSSFSNLDNSKELEFRYLSAADLKATTNAANARPWKKLIVKGYSSDMTALFMPLKSSVNKNILVHVSNKGILIYDHNGTPDNTSDDKHVFITSFTDQDGGSVQLHDTSAGYEDESGTLWVGADAGLFYFQPRNMLQGQAVLNRVKVARNDGTSLADYLLDGVKVVHITADGADRKWFGSMGAGIVVTSSDARKIHQEFSTENSDLVSDNIYWIEYNPASNSMMVSTDKGLQEFFINGSQSNEENKDEVRAYPNPVAPDYYGWVTIDGLPDNSLVKIVDAQGNLVRELGRAESGSIQWDVNNLYYKRVNTGVYYIMSSSATDGGKSANVAKILVMN